ncbi:MAG: DUF1579 domain-containing protein [Planctomycetes bacterium]|nr:DUF1579 domain-containing protein [Planctomycetota bacterium]
MKTQLSVALLSLLCIAPFTRAQEGGTPEMPKPGPEHANLQMAEGTWDAVVEGEGMEPSKGTSVMKMVLGGFWMSDHFTCDFGGMKFEGHGMTGYDPIKKKYVSTWVDNMNPALMVTEGTYDEKTRTLNMTGDGYDHMGNQVKVRTATIHKDRNTVVFEMYHKGAGAETKVMSITYTRRDASPAKPAK